MTSTYKEDIDKNFVSEYDRFLRAFDKEHPQKSASQQQEINKNARIAKKRDNPMAENDATDIL